jgi:hypothetical protein
MDELTVRFWEPGVPEIQQCFLGGQKANKLIARGSRGLTWSTPIYFG